VPTGTTAWAPRQLATCHGAPASGRWRCAHACAPAAACRRPRGRRRVMPVGTQCSQRLAMDRGSRACSGVRARRCGGKPTWQVSHDVACRHAQPHNNST
jgi:hypothetical protein